MIYFVIMQQCYLLQQRVNASQLSDLLAAIMQGVRDVATEVRDAGHV